jgi:hypothetical protein
MFKSTFFLSLIVSCLALNSAFGMGKQLTQSEYFYVADPEQLIFVSIAVDENESKTESSEQLQESASQSKVCTSDVTSEEFSRGSASRSQSPMSYFPYLAAPLSTLISTAVTYPLESVKIRLQSGTAMKGNFYRGFSSYAFAMCSSMGVALGGYDFLKKEGFSPAVSGLFSAVASNLITSPAWVYRINRSLSDKKSGSQSHFRSFLNDLRANPTKGYWGLSANMVNTLPQAVYFHIYEKMKKELESHITGDDAVADFARNAIASGSAKISISLFTFPMDTIRTWKQNTGLPYKTIVKDLAKQGKFRFYYGFMAATGKNVIATALQMATYEQLKVLMGTSKNCDTPTSSDEGTN